MVFPPFPNPGGVIRAAKTLSRPGSSSRGPVCTGRSVPWARPANVLAQKELRQKIKNLDSRFHGNDWHGEIAASPRKRAPRNDNLWCAVRTLPGSQRQSLVRGAHPTRLPAGLTPRRHILRTRRRTTRPPAERTAAGNAWPLPMHTSSPPSRARRARRPSSCRQAPRA